MTSKIIDEYSLALRLSKDKNINLNEIKRLLLSARKNGDDRASYAIATWYLFGNEVTIIDENLGVSILHELINSNIAEALFDLAVAYDLGKVVHQDENEAFSYYMMSALLGDKDSCCQVSQFYAEGRVVAFDSRLRDAWLERSHQDECDISPPYRVRI